mmetsp:Transcript_45104/g.142017  ORF Transcript_45104/g.142017 Transcript_45104/m.142017 type:complete len:329 (+) Transcript_45104:1012-1998(+)
MRVRSTSITVQNVIPRVESDADRVHDDGFVILCSCKCEISFFLRLLCTLGQRLVLLLHASSRLARMSTDVRMAHIAVIPDVVQPPLRRLAQQAADGSHHEPGLCSSFSARLRDVRGNKKLVLVEDFHHRVGGDGQGRKPVSSDLLQECGDGADDVIESMKRVVIHSLDDLKALGFCWALVVEDGRMANRDELILSSMDDQRRRVAVDDVGLVVESIHDHIGDRTHKLLRKRLDRPVRALQDQGCRLLPLLVQERDEVRRWASADRPPEDDHALWRDPQLLGEEIESSSGVAIDPPLARVARNRAIARILDSEDMDVEKITKCLEQIVR